MFKTSFFLNVLKKILIVNVKGAFHFIILQTSWEEHYFLKFSEDSEMSLKTI